MSIAGMAGVGVLLTLAVANLLPIVVRVLPCIPGWPRRNVLFVYGTLKR